MTTVGEWPVNRYVALMSIETPSAADLENLALASRSGWPEDLRVLITRFPREQWEGHANLGEMARFWLSRHAMFRELSGNIEQVTASFLKGDIPSAEFRASWCRGCNSCSRSSTCITISRTSTIFRFFAPPSSGWRAVSTCWK